MSKLILETLDTKRINAFNKLKSFNSLGILGGGTALALQIGHRKSYDFDIFVKEEINKLVWKKVKEVFGESSYKTLDTPEQLNLVTPDSINITFFLDDYKSMFPNIENEYIDLMDIRDIAANKALIQGKRPKWRDYVDLYFIIRDKYLSLDEIINVAIKKFGTDFSQKLFLEQLVYWGDIYNYEIDFVGDEIQIETVKSFLENEVREYSNKKLNL